MEKKDQLIQVQTHYLGRKIEDLLLLKQIKNFNLKTPTISLVLGSFFCHFYNHKVTVNETDIKINRIKDYISKNRI